MATVGFPPMTQQLYSNSLKRQEVGGVVVLSLTAHTTWLPAIFPKIKVKLKGCTFNTVESKYIQTIKELFPMKRKNCTRTSL